uniref:Uncharacterized protein n=1 Tax=Cyanoptyche gloeocystis TaxID=77922 RepID=A0A7S2NNI7_9EUKA|mmetsp:Transcript_1022/g.1934  ORF Transcript_1022/g.1934 Transcript_1022/m.1934 type:complete len:165 (+) Transcript_1022:48-542(+)|eukprot:CAMPEP_0196651884 /NCGR_PEP_ID=MMETSP1086-20130531/1058_1 /TAXON_ID=77921 /ORGANISM="Cyanoptyche  gloeocystis , Strain SAG4.97" /LENGTH=164 /DNA_ID=CAMNT_0041982175 /DNA_START=48 /DNA_END=542 /DNA_ORIENTATION=-
MPLVDGEQLKDIPPEQLLRLVNAGLEKEAKDTFESKRKKVVSQFQSIINNLTLTNVDLIRTYAKLALGYNQTTDKAENLVEAPPVFQEMINWIARGGVTTLNDELRLADVKESRKRPRPATKFESIDVTKEDIPTHGGKKTAFGGGRPGRWAKDRMEVEEDDLR